MKKAKKEAAKKEKPKKKISTKNLGEDQKEFIEAKVKELETIEKVIKFYDREDAVSAYALDIAKKLKLKKK